MEPSARQIPARATLLLGALTALLAACSLFPGASVSPNDAAVRALAAHQATWQAKNVDDYTLTVQRQCFCPFTEPVVVTVMDGVVTGATVDGQPAKPQDVQGIPKTVPELFAVVTANADAAKMTVEWNEAFGFPTSIQVDSIENAVDDEFGISVTDFRPAS